MTNVAVKLEQRDVLPEAFAEISGASFDGSQMQGKTAPLPEGLNATDGCSAAVIFRVNSSAEGLHAYRKSEIGRCFDDLYARYDQEIPSSFRSRPAEPYSP